MGKTTVDIIDLITSKLLQVQTKLQYSDAKMAKMLGVRANSWQAVRTRRRVMGSKMLFGAFKAFPDLEMFKDGKDRDIEITLKVSK
jgi:hypothetical protein